MKKATKKTGAMKKVAPKKVRKFDQGGVNTLKPKTAAEAVKGLVIGPVATAKTEAEDKAFKDANTGMNLLSTSKTATTTAAPKKKLLPGGFESEAQKTAYIKNVKNKIANGTTIEELVKAKVGTKAGLEALGFKDKVNAATPSTPRNASRDSKDPQAKGPILKNQKDSATVTVTAKRNKGGIKLTKQQINDWKKSAIESTAPKSDLVKDLISPAGIVKGVAAGAAAAYGAYKAYKGVKALKAAASSTAIKSATKMAKNTVTKLTSDKLAKAAKAVMKPKETLSTVGKKAADAVSKSIKPTLKTTAKETKATLGKKFAESVTKKQPQKLLNPGKPLLNQGQPMLNAGQKTLPAAKKSSAVVSKFGAQSLKNTTTGLKNTRANVADKLNKGIRTTNPAARSMKVADKKAALLTQQKSSAKESLKKLVKDKRNPQTKLKLK